MDENTRRVEGFDRGPAVMHGLEGHAGRRWAIWLQQIARRGEPCFGTERRYACQDASCVYRHACLRLQADWLR
jgi:hypothetical protein